MIQLVEKNDITPICPHCNTLLNTIAFRELRRFFGRRYIYFCSGCQKVLGVSHRKGFWMG
ncbi:MAG: hypothetical protein OEY18_00510 [Candidatus Aminicenantes bacterium]|nr:hypothetical protein [Candidatus Aminicenantes bacterium]MDH5383157.1 hypothetical protein [Candidatus Aminicenantes bacterium]